jgi:predicted transcriptional regulator
MPMPPARIVRQPHRDHYEVIRQILQTVYSKAGGCKPFELAYRCQLTWPQFIWYRDLLITNKLLIPSNTNPTRRYEITPKGERFLKIFAEIGRFKAYCPKLSPLNGGRTRTLLGFESL